MIGTTGVQHHKSRTDVQDGAWAGRDRQCQRQRSSPTDTVQRLGRYRRDFQLKMHRKAFGGRFRPNQLMELTALSQLPIWIYGGGPQRKRKEGRGEETPQFWKQIIATASCHQRGYVFASDCLSVCMFFSPFACLATRVIITGTSN